MQTACYAGVPMAVNALTAAADVLQPEGVGVSGPLRAVADRRPAPRLGRDGARRVARRRARAGGRLVLRVEDIDGPRVVAGSEARQLDDLRWLGLDWDEGPDVGGPHAPYRQSERGAALRGRARARSRRDGLLYYCDCSRAEIARASRARRTPATKAPRYPGTCRDFGLRERAWKRPPAIRLARPRRRRRTSTTRSRAAVDAGRRRARSATSC